MCTIDFEECLKDSPAYRYVIRRICLSVSFVLNIFYRNQLRQAFNHIETLEDRLEQMLKMCNSVISNGKIFIQEFQ